MKNSIAQRQQDVVTERTAKVRKFEKLQEKYAKYWKKQPEKMSKLNKYILQHSKHAMGEKSANEIQEELKGTELGIQRQVLLHMIRVLFALDHPEKPGKYHPHPKKTRQKMKDVETKVAMEVIDNLPQIPFDFDEGEEYGILPVFIDAENFEKTQGGITYSNKKDLAEGLVELMKCYGVTWDGIRLYPNQVQIFEYKEIKIENVREDVGVVRDPHRF